MTDIDLAVGKRFCRWPVSVGESANTNKSGFISFHHHHHHHHHHHPSPPPPPPNDISINCPQPLRKLRMQMQFSSVLRAPVFLHICMNDTWPLPRIRHQEFIVEKLKGNRREYATWLVWKCHNNKMCKYSHLLASLILFVLWMFNQNYFSALNLVSSWRRHFVSLFTNEDKTLFFSFLTF